MQLSGTHEHLTASEPKGAVAVGVFLNALFDDLVCKNTRESEIFFSIFRKLVLDLKISLFFLLWAVRGHQNIM